MKIILRFILLILAFYCVVFPQTDGQIPSWQNNKWTPSFLNIPDTIIISTSGDCHKTWTVAVYDKYGNKINKRMPVEFWWSTTNMGTPTAPSGGSLNGLNVTTGFVFDWNGSTSGMADVHKLKQGVTDANGDFAVNIGFGEYNAGTVTLYFHIKIGNLINSKSGQVNTTGTLCSPP